MKLKENLGESEARQTIPRLDTKGTIHEGKNIHWTS